MKYTAWEAKIVAANSLIDCIDEFRQSNDRVWYVDRHIISSDREIPVLEDTDGFGSVTRAAARVFEEWNACVVALPDTSVIVTRPILTIHDEWLRRTENATPPTIRTCLAKSCKYLIPEVIPRLAEVPLYFGDEVRALVLGKGYTVVRVDGIDATGAWLIYDTYTGLQAELPHAPEPAQPG